MPTIDNGSVSLHVEDSGGDGRPVVLVHAWPLSSASWSEQVPVLTAAGYRVVAYDRRGFGSSGKPGVGSTYDYDTLAGDLDAVLTSLDLRDVTLVGFSMGGGEVARYLGTRGSDRVRSAVFAAAIPPCLHLDDTKPDGALDDATVRSYQQALVADSPGFLDGFTRNFFTADGVLKVSDEQHQAALAVALQAELNAASECIRSWTTDFTDDLARITVPTLVIHGDSDAVVPLEKSGLRTHEHVPGSELHVIEGGPHGINVSHAEEFNEALLAFLDR